MEYTSSRWDGHRPSPETRATGFGARRPPAYYRSTNFWIFPVEVLGSSPRGRFVGGALADDPGRRRAVAVGGYTVTAVEVAGAAGDVAGGGRLQAGQTAARSDEVGVRSEVPG